MLTGEQIRAARALARIEQVRLAEMADVSLATVKRLESIAGPIGANTSTEVAIRRAFNEAGVIFIDENGQGPGVRLRKVKTANEMAIAGSRVERFADSDFGALIRGSLAVDRAGNMLRFQTAHEAQAFVEEQEGHLGPLP